MAELFGKDLADLKTNREFLEDFHGYAFPNIDYYVLNTDQPTDSLYNETLAKQFAGPFSVPAYFRADPSTKILARYGIESWQPAIAVFDNVTLSRMQVDPKPGDRVKYFDILYEVLTVKFTDYWINSQYPMSRVITMKNLEER